MPDVFVSPDEKLHSETPSPIPEKPPVTETQKKKIQGHTHSKFSSFCLYPDDVDFETRDENEQIILFLRQHPLINVKWILTTILLLSGPTLLGLIGVYEFLPTGFGLVLSLSWYLVTSAYAIEKFLSWYFNVYFITERRVVDVDFYNLVNKKVSDAEIEKVQDVSYQTGGVVRTMFNYGDVLIQTASEVTEFEFGAVPSPEKVAKILNDLMAKV
jgi:hypothetical protein